MNDQKSDQAPLHPRGLSNRVALVTGGSRGTGARIAVRLAEARCDVAITFRDKAIRADRVVEEIAACGRQGLAVQSDMTSPAQTAQLAERLRSSFGRVDLLILNASGGMEKDRPADYSLRINRDAQIATVHAILPLMPAGSRIVFLTSHAAHFYPDKPVYPVYEAVAAGKRAGENALRDLIPELAGMDIALIVVSGDLIEDTIVARLLERSSRGLIAGRRDQVGQLPTTDDLARAVVDAASDGYLKSGATVYVGSTN